MFAREKGKTRDDAKWDDLKHVSQELGAPDILTSMKIHADSDSFLLRMVLGWCFGWST